MDSGVGGSDFASFLIGMGETPGSESYNFTKDLFVAEAESLLRSLSFRIRGMPPRAFTLTAGLRWDIFGGRTERHNRLEYFDPNASSTRGGVAYTGAEVYVNGGQPLSVHNQPEGFRPAARPSPGSR